MPLASSIAQARPTSAGRARQNPGLVSITCEHLCKMPQSRVDYCASSCRVSKHSRSSTANQRSSSSGSACDTFEQQCNRCGETSPNRWFRHSACPVMCQLAKSCGPHDDLAVKAFGETRTCLLHASELHCIRLKSVPYIHRIQILRRC